MEAVGRRIGRRGPLLFRLALLFFSFASLSSTSDGREPPRAVERRAPGAELRGAELNGAEEHFATLAPLPVESEPFPRIILPGDPNHGSAPLANDPEPDAAATMGHTAGPETSAEPTLPATTDQTQTKEPAAEPTLPATMEQTAAAQPVASQAPATTIDQTSGTEPYLPATMDQADITEPSGEPQLLVTEPSAEFDPPTFVDQSAVAEPLAETEVPATMDQTAATKLPAEPQLPTTVDQSAVNEPPSVPDLPTTMDQSAVNEPPSGPDLPTTMDQSAVNEPLSRPDLPTTIDQSAVNEPPSGPDLPSTMDQTAATELPAEPQAPTTVDQSAMAELLAEPQPPVIRDQTVVKEPFSETAHVPVMEFNPLVKRGRHLDASLEEMSTALRGIVLPKTSSFRQRVFINKKTSVGAPAGSYEALPETDIPADRHRTCAVVGSSGALLAAEGGGIIDDHDAVFRMNDCPVGGYEQYVGSKTTYRLVNTVAVEEYVHTGRPAGTTENNTVLFSPLSIHHTAELIQMYPEDNFLILAEEFVQRVHGQWTELFDRMSQSGFVNLRRLNPAPVELETLYMAFHLCERVHLYGFGFADASLNLTHHYFDAEPMDSSVRDLGFHDTFFQLLEHHDLLSICQHDSVSLECHLPRSDYADTSAYLRAAEPLATAQSRGSLRHLRDDRQLR